MREVRISDGTMKQSGHTKEISLTFKEKLEMAKLLDRLGVAVIEAEGIEQTKIDSLRIKSIASSVKNSILAVPVKLNQESVSITWNALKLARSPRLQVPAAISPTQMEYIHHLKAPAMLTAIEDTVRACRNLTEDVEFIADDATRSDQDFLYKAVRAAIEAGASTITICDAAGTMLPDEFTQFLETLYENVPELKDVVLGVSCSDDLSMADACAVAAVIAGAGEVKAAAYPVSMISLANVVRILNNKQDICQVVCRTGMTEMKRITDQIRWMCETGRSAKSPFDNGVEDGDKEISLTEHDDLTAVMKQVEKLGYDLSEEDGAQVYEEFLSIARKKERVSLKELERVIASTAMQVPATYVLESYVINSGNLLTSTAHLKIRKNDQMQESVTLGDGPIDAAFLAIESIVGQHYELDDFQIQTVTEGRDAMGEALVKIRHEGKVYSGRGISTDIIGSSIRAYVNALNKIVYEETNS
ncbi:MAG: hypothetical protein IJV14_11600 [Lachnospiraceae bacterium]|nr:hypothetical protein [Lachnospiraceae bacterium]